MLGFREMDTARSGRSRLKREDYHTSRQPKTHSTASKMLQS